MARNIRIDRSEAEFLTDLLLSSDNPMAKEIGDEIRDVFGMVSEEKEKQLTDNLINFDTFIAESNEFIEKVGEVMLDGVKDIYSNPCVIRPVITLEEFIKFRDKMARPS